MRSEVHCGLIFKRAEEDHISHDIESRSSVPYLRCFDVMLFIGNDASADLMIVGTDCYVNYVTVRCAPFFFFAHDKLLSSHRYELKS